MESKHIAKKKAPRCKARTASGARCKARPLVGKAYCFWHDPDKSEDRREAGRTGGQKGRCRTLPPNAPDFSIECAQDVAGLLTRTINQTLRGEIDPKVANAVGYLSGVILRDREQGEIEERIARIEAALEAKEGGGR